MAQQFTDDRSDGARGFRSRRRPGPGFAAWDGLGRRPHDHDHDGDHGHRHDHGDRNEHRHDDEGHRHGRGGRLSGRDGRGHRHDGRGGELRTSAVSLIAAARQVAIIGDDTQRQSARAIMDTAVRAIYAVLAEGPAPTDPTGASDGTEAPAAAQLEADADDAGTAA